MELDVEAVPFEQEDPELGNLITFFTQKLASKPEDKPNRRRHPIYAIDRWSAYSGIGRNEPCPCKSGKKFKVCCINT